MKIVSLKSKNVKNLKAVEITPEGNTVILTGKNGAGKSAVLDSIQYAFSGRSIPAKPIREGEENAKVEIDCGEFTVTRTFGKRGNAVKIETKTGDVKKSPQAFLDGIVGKISFDPMEFIRMDSAKQKAVLMDLVGLDVTAMDEKERGLELKRTEAGREYRKLKGSFDVLEEVKDPPKEIVPATTLFEEKESINKFNKDIDIKMEEALRIKQEAEDLEESIQSEETCIEEWLQEISAIQKNIDKCRSEINEMKKSSEKLHALNKTQEDELSKLEKKPLEEIDEKIKNVDKDNENYRKHQDYLAAKEKLEAAVQTGKDKTSALETYREEKARKIKEAKYPIEGLSFGSDGVCFNGIPIDQVNSAEQIKVGVAVSMALNPTLKVLRISDGSLLDSNSLKMIDSLITEKDYQLWIEKVDETGKVGIYIEEGEVKKN